MRHRLYYWLKRKFKIAEGSILPWWFVPFSIVFRPILYLRWGLWENLGPIKVSFESNTVTIYGVEMSWEFIDQLRRGGV